MIKVRQFYVVGRALPSESVPEPTLYRIRIFARDETLARSKFWYHMKRQHKVRRIQGEIVNVSEIHEKRAGTMKNFGIFLRYDTRTCTINMYKEYRDTTLCGAVSQLYMEMSGRHSGRGETLQVIRTSVLRDTQPKEGAVSELRRMSTIQFADKKIRFPKVYTVKRAPIRQLKTIFKADRPTLF
jgi:large subunit ribosomal protein L18Ae